MEFAQSHKIEYKDYKDIDTKIEIWEDGYNGNVVECEAADDPLNVDIAPMDPMIQIPVIGTGATLKLNSASNGQFLNLYTLNPMKRMVKIYKDNKTYPWWLGYINTELYGEPYSRLQDYPVIINCNDGFNALTRYKYLDGSGNKYTTLETKWNILTRIITKMGLPFQYLYFACDHSCDGITVGSDETLFHNLKVDQLNYYDEKDIPMTFRQVLEALLRPYPLQIRWYNGCLIIYEPQMLALSSFSAKKFDSSFAYVSTGNLSMNFDISNGDINWDNEDQNIDIISGFSRQRIRYSPYIQDGAIKEYDITDRANWTGTEDWSLDGNGVWRLSGITAIAGFTMHTGDSPSSKNAYFTGNKQTFTSQEDVYFEKNGLSDDYNDIDFLTITSGRKVTFKENQIIGLLGKVYIRSKFNEFGNEQGTMARCIIIPFHVTINGYGPYMGQDGYTWSLGDGDEFNAVVINNGGICDRWCDFNAPVPWNMPSGIIQFKIKDPKVYTSYTGTQLHAVDGIYSLRLKDFKARIFNMPGEPVGGMSGGVSSLKEIENKDREYSGTLNEEFINEASEITLQHADAKNITDRGSIIKLDGSIPTGWKKTGDSVSYRLADLLLRAINSQYRDILTQLSGTLEADSLMASNGGPGFLFTIQDTDYLSSIKFLFIGGTYNDFRRTLNGKFLEIKQDNLDLNIIS